MPMPPKKHTSAFSMLELVFVIVILGIVSSIGSQIIVQVYENYITQRALHRSSVKTELATTQLSNRLAYSIPGTVIGRIDNATFASIGNIPPGATNFTILEWIGYDADSFEAITATTALGRRPIWSGYADVDSSTRDNLSTPGSRLGKLDTIIDNLSTSRIGDAAILFPGATAHTVGFAETARSTANIHPVASAPTDTALALDALGIARTIKEHYKLAWTAYAVEPFNPHVMPGTTGIVWDLRLWSDYQPWDGESYTDGTSALLIRNISVFKFTGSGNTIRLKLCQRENIGEAFTTNSCKEKAVIR